MTFEMAFDKLIAMYNKKNWEIQILIKIDFSSLTYFSIIYTVIVSLKIDNRW